jgi:hypothetical protein
VEFVDRALERTFDRLAADAGRVAIEGFSDVLGVRPTPPLPAAGALYTPSPFNKSFVLRF